MSTPTEPKGIRLRSGKLRDSHINLAHGSGGKAMRDLIEDVFVGAFDNPMLAAMEDQAVFSLADLARHGNRLAFTTDTFVVGTKLYFTPGGSSAAGAFTITPVANSVLAGVITAEQGAGGAQTAVSFRPAASGGNKNVKCERVVIDAATLRSKSKNSPFDGRRLQGKVPGTWVGGRKVF